MSNVRHLHVLGATGTIRTAMHDGREHIVVPVVALMEGVIHAINADTPEFVPFKTLAHQPERWNGFPAVLNHPSRNGVQISAKEPGVLDAQGIGTIFKTCVRGKKLCLEAWIDPAKAAKTDLGRRTLERVKRGEPIEVSVGAYVTTLKNAGSYNGRSYKAEWQTIEPDHIAFLPEGVGACSIEMGCGAHRAAAMNTTHLITAQGYETLSEDDKPRLTSKSLRERLAALLRAAGSVYDTQQEAVSEEVAELVKFKGLKEICKNLGKSYDAVETLIDELIAAESVHATGADETAETEIEAAKLETIRAMILGMYGTINTIMDLTNPVQVYGETYSQRHMAGKRNSDADLAIIQNVHDHSVSLGANCKEPKSLRAAGCGCHKGTQEMKNKNERIAALMAHAHSPVKDIKVLEAASEEVLTALEASAETAKAAAEKLTAAETAKTAAETAKATAEAALKTAQEAPITADRLPAEIKTIVEEHNLRTAEEKTTLIESLKTAAAGTYTEDELKAMSNDQLRRLATLARVEQPAAKNYAGNGVVRTPEKTENFAPPDPYAAGLTALQNNKK